MRPFQGVFTVVTSVIRKRIAVKRVSAGVIVTHQHLLLSISRQVPQHRLTILLTEGMRGCVTHVNMSITLTRTLHQTHESPGSM